MFISISSRSIVDRSSRLDSHFAVYYAKRLSVTIDPWLLASTVMVSRPVFRTQAGDGKRMVISPLRTIDGERDVGLL